MRQFVVIAGLFLFGGCGSAEGIDGSDAAGSAKEMTNKSGSKGDKKARPRNPEAEALIVSAQIFLSDNEIQKAIEAFSQAIELDPQNADAYSARAKAFALVGQNASAFSDSARITFASISVAPTTPKQFGSFSEPALSFRWSTA